MENTYGLLRICVSDKSEILAFRRESGIHRRCQRWQYTLSIVSERLRL